MGICKVAALSLGVFLSMALPSCGGTPAEYFPKKPILGWWSAEVTERVVWMAIDNPKLSNRDIRIGVGIEESLWDIKLMSVYVELLKLMTMEEGLKLAGEQIEWQAMRKSRTEKYMDREQFGAEGVLDHAREYSDVTRWRVAHLEERADKINRAEGTSGKAKPGRDAAPKDLIPEGLLTILEADSVLEWISKARPGKEYGNLSAEGVDLMADIWDGQLLGTYLTVLRGLSPSEARALAEEQTKWDEGRVRLVYDRTRWQGWKEETEKRIAELEARLPKIEELPPQGD